MAKKVVNIFDEFVMRQVQETREIALLTQRDFQSHEETCTEFKRQTHEALQSINNVNSQVLKTLGEMKTDQALMSSSQSLILANVKNMATEKAFKILWSIATFVGVAVASATANWFMNKIFT